ncbi:uncharacterized protein L969DRAFT_50573 [Mixia osmundae IAM 14324]|uniref:Uncharacterized protein n=1 Tax=Mixia osmundae (strain CBS 9802 / IAM 14324 / JCM 22182 / KY 12970) TaxID=764103 RepID=G7E734_MIXOS|nr:uncharacterized protein L969DRAFT_50573 [Mixia osmundae IAM 14324]KEI38973.1 hypothetical protein L969DRAFT_50573 [Mixia osmundae IAM 14324]GAA98644.1 hypothetical protein E5Q_05331 [Mixia osmundae IAM 14324]
MLWLVVCLLASPLSAAAAWLDTVTSSRLFCLQQTYCRMTCASKREQGHPFNIELELEAPHYRGHMDLITSPRSRVQNCAICTPPLKCRAYPQPLDPSRIDWLLEADRRLTVRKILSGDLLAQRLIDDCCRIFLRRHFDIQRFKDTPAVMSQQYVTMVCDPILAGSRHCGLLFSERTAWDMTACEYETDTCQVEFGTTLKNRQCSKKLYDHPFTLDLELGTSAYEGYLTLISNRPEDVPSCMCCTPPLRCRARPQEMDPSRVNWVMEADVRLAVTGIPSGDPLAARLMQDCCHVVLRRRFEVQLRKAAPARLVSETVTMICDPRNAMSGHCGLLFSQRTTWDLRDCESIDTSCQADFASLTHGRMCKWSDGTISRPSAVPDAYPACPDAPQ